MIYVVMIIFTFLLGFVVVHLEEYLFRLRNLERKCKRLEEGLGDLCEELEDEVKEMLAKNNDTEI